MRNIYIFTQSSNGIPFNKDIIYVNNVRFLFKKEKKEILYNLKKNLKKKTLNIDYSIYDSKTLFLLLDRTI
ncbi:hypothetical protein RclHR1_01270003 [Rhizophagus clarus]|uniref:Uncharacterized protein n=1 Tax=Rhizophagus clarus TaxID=94130 RepID=A0A2Z6Q7U8_9GLOM|nr:hypothetical protein RclHR1_01270003 [Rhizophagus clarus]GES82375.1 hypothetical protein RCL_jg4986.t1 [Rhizophagus clarus]